MAEDRRSLGEFIRERREELGITLRALAVLGGVSPPFLSDVEHGRRGASRDTMNRIAPALKVDVRELVSRSLSSVKDEEFWKAHPELLRMVQAHQRQCSCPHCLILK